MFITMVRHGQTDANFNRIIQGRIDNPLNEIGRTQAHTVGKHLNSLEHHYDFIISSQLSRALETAFIIEQYVESNQPIIISHHLVEREFGYLEEKPFEEAIFFIKTNPQNNFGYENDEKIIKRVKKAISDLYNRYKDKNLLIVAHSHVIKSMLVIVDPNKYSFSEHRLQNTEFYHFEVKDQLITLKK